ncbi:hypothetical protein HK105_207984 [Polyrhizophydium stewartii]|uniref:Uncharacterized protein n=1 Tax=Polyrhizophydium stewartii TaxID=2732419 RepID=A0ABR4MYZ4_9FUNG
MSSLHTLTLPLVPYANQANRYLSRSGTLRYYEKELGVPKLYLALGLYLVGTLALFVGPAGLAAFVANLVAIAYPTHAAMRAAVNNDTEALKTWATYFAVYGYMVTFVDTVGLQYVPWYYAVRTALLAVLFSSPTMGAAKIYELALPHLDVLYRAKKRD